MGYFRNATTITECLHTYCRSCILRYFQESKKDCPVCGHDLSPYPLEMIRHDHMTQSIINKMLANDWTPAGGDDNRKETSRATRGTRGRTSEMLELPPKTKRTKSKQSEHTAKPAAELAEPEKSTDAQNDTEMDKDAAQVEPEGEGTDEDDLGHESGEPAEGAHDGPDEPSDEDDENEEEEQVATEALTDAHKGAEGEDPSTPVEAPANDVNFSLIHDPEQDTVSSKLGVLQKPYLRTSASISILQLKKYLTSKFFGNEPGPPIKLMCRGQLCKDQMRVGDISTETWKDNSKDLELVYHA